MIIFRFIGSVRGKNILMMSGITSWINKNLNKLAGYGIIQWR